MVGIKLGTTTVTPTGRPYVIAEIGVNHEGSLATAKQLIELAHEGGAHAAKFQSYKVSKTNMVMMQRRLCMPLLPNRQWKKLSKIKN